MKGYTFEYYKYVRYPEDSMSDIRDCFSNEVKKSILTFGEYDRLKINVIEEFDRFRDLSALAKNWIGNRQSIFLYNFESKAEEVELEFDYREEEGFWDFTTGEYDQHLFWALTELPFRNELREKMLDYEELLQSAQENLRRIINQEILEGVTNCRYMPMGILGIFGISVLWFSNQYTDILKIVNKIKGESHYKNERMYLSAHTRLSKNPFYNQVGEDNELVKKISGKALIQITLKKWLNKELSFDGKHTFGEYDLIVEMEARKAFVSFESEDIFNHDSDKYQNNILQTCIIFADEVNNCDLGMETVDSIDAKNLSDRLNTSVKIENNELVKNLDKVKNVYEELRRLIAKKIDKKAGMIDTLDSLHCDYRYNVASAVNQSWARDFSYIFLKNLECIKEIISMTDNNDVEFMAILRMVLNNLKQQIFHISEVNSLSFELPKCHLRYTGQEDCILFCYMGIIKEILDVAYQLNSTNKQTEIIPIVTVDAVPIIESELYFDKAMLIDKGSKDQDFKILSLNLPHVTFYDIPLYIQYFYHEIFHYIVPEDRENRDIIIGTLLSTIYIINVLYAVFKDQISTEILVEQITNYIQPLLLNIVSLNYLNVHLTITKFNSCKKKIDTDTILLIEKVYKEELINYLASDHSFVGECVKGLVKHLKAGDFQGISFRNLRLKVEEKYVEKIIEILDNWDKSYNGNKIFESHFDLNVRMIDKFMEGMEEVSADIPMIEFCQMPLEEYMVLYVHCLKHELKDSKIVDFDEELKEVIRVGVVLDYYTEKGISLEKIKELFLDKYIARYVNFSKDTDCVLVMKEKIDNRRREAEEWYKYFETYWINYNSRFGLYKKQCRMWVETSHIERRLPENVFLDEKATFYFGAYRKIFQDFGESVRGLEIMCKEDREDSKILSSCKEKEKIFHEKIFMENIRLINYFQKQKSLEELHDINEMNNQKRKDKNINYTTPNIGNIFAGGEVETKSEKLIQNVTVYGLESFLSEIDSITKTLTRSCNKILGKGPWPLWYRGQESSSYGLLPSIMRENNRRKEDFHYLSQYQRYLFEEFKYRADGAPEVMDRSYYNISDYLALMQHYGVCTNLIDWSEDAFTGLY